MNEPRWIVNVKDVFWMTHKIHASHSVLCVRKHCSVLSKKLLSASQHDEYDHSMLLMISTYNVQYIYHIKLF